MARSRRKRPQTPSRLILDSGAVIAAARGDARARAFLARAIELDATVEVPVVVVAETIRGGPRDAPVNRVLKAIGAVPALREAHGRIAGALLAPAGPAATVDALVVAHAVSAGGATSSPATRMTCGNWRRDVLRSSSTTSAPFDRIEAPEEAAVSRALLVIDVQNEYFTGALPITHPAGHLEHILKVMDAAAGRIPTVVIQHHAENMPIFRKGSPEWELHPEVAARPRNVLIQKSLPGSFTNTSLEAWLRERGVDTVTIAGYMTHMCCDTTAREAVHRGFKAEFLSDATGTLPLSNAGGQVTAEELQRSILTAQAQLLSEVLPSDQWIERVKNEQRS